MQVQTAIAQHLNIAETAIIKIEEWAHVLFVVVRGLGGRFVSKKVIPTMKEQVTGYQLATRIAEAINQNDNYLAKIWDKKAGETRVYVSSYGGKKIKDFGFVRVLSSGQVQRELTRQAGAIEALYSDVVAAVEIVPAPSVSSNLNDLQKAAREHKAGYNVDSGTLFDAYKAGYLSMSDAMNSDF